MEVPVVEYIFITTSVASNKGEKHLCVRFEPHGLAISLRAHSLCNGMEGFRGDSTLIPMNIDRINRFYIDSKKIRKILKYVR